MMPDSASHAAVRRRVVVVTTAVACLLTADWIVRRNHIPIRAYDLDTFGRKSATLASRPAGDVVLLGSSRAMYALVPAEFEAVTGRPAFNLSISDTKPVEWLALAGRLFEQRRPGLVVLGVNAGELRCDSLPTAAVRHLLDLEGFIDFTRRYGWSGNTVGAFARHWLGSPWAAFDKRFELRMWLQEQADSVVGGLSAYATEAREMRERVIRSAAADGYQHPWLAGRQRRTLEERLTDRPPRVRAATVPPFDPHGVGLNSFGRLLDWFQQHRVPLLVVYVPNSPRTECRWQEVEPCFLGAIAAICERQHVPFMRMDAAELPRTNRDFFDEIHVGVDLARRLSRRVAGEIVSLGLLDVAQPVLARSGEAGAAEP